LRAVLIAGLVVAALAPAAQADEVFRIHSSSGTIAPRPTVAVDSRGVGHVVFRDQEAGARYCRVPRNRNRCDRTLRLAADRRLEDRAHVFALSDSSIVVVGTLEIAGGSGSDIALWRSDDGGNSFASVPVANNEGVNESFDDAALGPGANLSLGSFSHFTNLSLGSPEAHRSAVLGTGLTNPGGGAVSQAAVGVAGTTPVVVNWYDEGSELSFNRLTGGDPHDDANWTEGELVPGVGEPHPAFLATGNSGLLLVHHAGGGRYDARLFDGLRFGDPARVRIFELFSNDAPDQGGHPDADLFAQGAAYHAAWDKLARSGGTNDVLWSWSLDGRRFSRPLMIAEDVQGEDVQVAASSGFRGLAVWGPGISSVFATHLEPVGGFAGCRPPDCELLGGRGTRRVGRSRLSLDVGFRECGPPVRLRPRVRRRGSGPRIDRVRFDTGSGETRRVRAEVRLGGREVTLTRRIRVCPAA